MVLDEAQAIKNADHGVGQGGAAAARRASPGAQRHAGGESPGRVVEPVRVPQSGHAGRGARCCKMAGGLARNPGEEARAAAGAGAAAVHPAAHQGAGGARTAREDRADHLLRTGRPRSGSSTTSCASTTASRCWRACERRASGSRRCRCSKRCCGCGRRPAIPACSTPSASDEPSAKLDVLLDAAGARCCEEGHKALVFSQFTSLLAIVRAAAGRGGRPLRVPGRRARATARRTSSRSRTIRTAGCS